MSPRRPKVGLLLFYWGRRAQPHLFIYVCIQAKFLRPLYHHFPRFLTLLCKCVLQNISATLLRSYVYARNPCCCIVAWEPHLVAGASVLYCTRKTFHYCILWVHYFRLCFICIYFVAPQKVNADNEAAHCSCLCNIHCFSYMEFISTAYKRVSRGHFQSRFHAW